MYLKINLQFFILKIIIIIIIYILFIIYFYIKILYFILLKKDIFIKKYKQDLFKFFSNIIYN